MNYGLLNLSYKIPQGRIKPKKKSSFGAKKPFKGKGKNRKGKKVLSHIVTDNRLKPKAIKESSYIKWFHEAFQPPCFVCGGFLGIEFHHVKKHSTDERIDAVGMALCYNHHHGTELSPHGTPRKFKEVYPIKMQFENAAKMYEKFKENQDD